MKQKVVTALFFLSGGAIAYQVGYNVGWHDAVDWVRFASKARFRATTTEVQDEERHGQR